MSKQTTTDATAPRVTANKVFVDRVFKTVRYANNPESAVGLTFWRIEQRKGQNGAERPRYFPPKVGCTTTLTEDQQRRILEIVNESRESNKFVSCFMTEKAKAKVEKDSK